MSKWTEIRDKIEMGFSFAWSILPEALQFVKKLPLPPWVQTVVNIIIPGLMAVAEVVYPESGSGAVKKEKVMEGVEKFFDMLGQIFTGGALENFDAIRGDLSNAIDAAVGIFNKFEPGIISDDGTLPPGSPGESQ